MSAALRLGLIGCGRIATAGYLPAIAACEELSLVAVADPAPARRHELAGLASAREFCAAGEMIAAGGLDAVIVAGPVDTHVEHARLASEAGLACLVEKPPAPDRTAALELARLDPAPWVGFNRRFEQGAKLVGAIPDDGSFALELELRYRRASWRTYYVRDDALLDLGPHLIDLALLLTGGPARVRDAVCAPERAEIELEIPRGGVSIRCATDRPYFERAVVARPDGRRLTTSVNGGLGRGLLARLERRPHPLVGSLARQLSAFAAAARGGGAGVLATAADGARAMALIDEARLRASAGVAPEPVGPLLPEPIA